VKFGIGDAYENLSGKYPNWVKNRQKCQGLFVKTCEI
jgi:hypothetical protein